MSKLVRSSMDSMRPTTLYESDRRAYLLDRQDRGFQQQWADGMLWSSSRGVGQGLAGPLGTDASNYSGHWGVRMPQNSGNSTRLRITGVTRGAGGAAIGGVTVQAVAADGSSAGDRVTSDAAGFYEATVQNPPTGQQYKVDAYLVGSPDIAGTTVNTLVPS